MVFTVQNKIQGIREDFDIEFEKVYNYIDTIK